VLAELPPGLLSTAHTLQFAALSVKVLRTAPQLDHHVGPVTTTYRDPAAHPEAATDGFAFISFRVTP